MCVSKFLTRSMDFRMLQSHNRPLMGAILECMSCITALNTMVLICLSPQCIIRSPSVVLVGCNYNTNNSDNHP